MAKRKTRGQYHGYVVIDKPAGVTSHDVVGRVRRIVGERRVGHAGTLDPAATGVLPIAIGLATRTVEYLSRADKSYLADVTFGVETDTADGDGTVVRVAGAAGLHEHAVRDALAAFSGLITQTPPMHSAIKVDGVPMYELARRGESRELEPRDVMIHQIELLSWQSPTAVISVTCSKGTYIRSLARDLGNALGCGAYMSGLVRTRTGPFTLCDAMTLQEFEDSFTAEQWEHVAAHPDRVLQDRAAIILDADHARIWLNGNPLSIDAPEDEIRVYDVDGRWLGVGIGPGSVDPLKVVVERADNE